MGELRGSSFLNAVLACAVLAAACATRSVAPEVDLGAPGWTVRTGQALWKRPDRPALAGEVMVARHDNGDVVVSFSKPPVPIFTARARGPSGEPSGRRSWRIDFVDRGRSYAGRGRPPKRLVWLYLGDLLAGGHLPGPWIVETTSGEVSLRHRRSGETIRLVLDPPS